MRARRPPRGLSSSTISPPWARTISRAIVRPRPVPPDRSALERAEHALALVGRNTGPVVVDRDQHGTALCHRRQHDMPCMPAGIVHQVGDRPTHRVGAQLQRQVRRHIQVQQRSGPPRSGGDIVQNRCKIDRFGLLRPLAAGEREVAADHAVHLLHIGGHFGHVLARVPRCAAASPAPAAGGSAACADRATRPPASPSAAPGSGGCVPACG